MMLLESLNAIIVNKISKFINFYKLYNVTYLRIITSIKNNILTLLYTYINYVHNLFINIYSFL